MQWNIRIAEYAFTFSGTAYQKVKPKRAMHGGGNARDYVGGKEK